MSLKKCQFTSAKGGQELTQHNVNKVVIARSQLKADDAAIPVKRPSSPGRVYILAGVAGFEPFQKPAVIVED